MKLARGMTSFGNVRGIDRASSRTFRRTLWPGWGKVEAWRYPFCTDGSYGRYPLFSSGVNLYPSAEYKRLNAINSTSRYELVLGLEIRTRGRSSSLLLMLNLITYAMLNSATSYITFTLLYKCFYAKLVNPCYYPNA